MKCGVLTASEQRLVVQVWCICESRSSNGKLAGRPCVKTTEPEDISLVTCTPPNRVIILWLIVAFDIDGEVSFSGTSMVTNTIFRPAPNEHCVYFKLRHQYHVW